MIALAFGLLSVWFTLKIAGKNSSRSMVYLVLAGVIASSLFNAVGSLLKYTADPQDKLPEITYWLMGSFTGASYKKIAVGSPLILSGIMVIYLLRWRLNILSLSEDEAKASGINLPRTRLIFILASTVITASAVSMCGQVGWIGLLIPHCARMLVGSNNRYVIPVSLSLGASFMILIDTLSRLRLVEDNQLRLVDERAGNQNHLQFAAAHAVAILVGQTGDADLFHHALGHLDFPRARLLERAGDGAGFPQSDSCVGYGQASVWRRGDQRHYEHALPNQRHVRFG